MYCLTYKQWNNLENMSYVTEILFNITMIHFTRSKKENFLSNLHLLLLFSYNKGYPLSERNCNIVMN